MDSGALGSLWLTICQAMTDDLPALPSPGRGVEDGLQFA
jgi:hypothetical protein